MTSGERDDLVETVLKGGALHRRAHATDEACLDAEAAAAWLDGGLDGEALATAQAHVAGCGRCQHLLHVLMETDAASAPVSAAAIEQPAFGRRDATGAAARWAWLRWGTPIGAALAATLALAVWLRVPSPDSGPQPASPASQAAAEAARDDQQPATPAEQQRRDTRPQVAAATEPAPPAAAKAAAPIVPPLSPPAGAVSENRLVGAVSGGFVGGVAGASETATPPPSAPPPPPVPAAAAAPPSANAAPAAALRERTALAADAVARVAIDVRAQSGPERWRVSGTRIERSRNDGQTWSDIGAVTGGPLTAGSAPAVGTCWFVGLGGTVLVFDDATGVQRASVPDGADLVSVTARSAAEAVVVTADGRRLRTTDTGRTWTAER